MCIYIYIYMYTYTFYDVYTEIHDYLSLSIYIYIYMIVLCCYVMCLNVLHCLRACCNIHVNICCSYFLFVLPVVMYRITSIRLQALWEFHSGRGKDGFMDRSPVLHAFGKCPRCWPRLGAASFSLEGWLFRNYRGPQHFKPGRAYLGNSKKDWPWTCSRSHERPREESLDSRPWSLEVVAGQ